MPTRQLERCPGSRKIRVCNRKLGICGPGGGPHCGICFGRALTGHPCNSCGGFFRPFVSLGARYLVQAEGTAITGADVMFSQGAGRRVSAIALFRERYVVSSAFLSPQLCWPVLESYSGTITLGGQWTEIAPTLPGGQVVTSIPGQSFDLEPTVNGGGAAYPIAHPDQLNWPHCPPTAGNGAGPGDDAAYRNPAFVAHRIRTGIVHGFGPWVAPYIAGAPWINDLRWWWHFGHLEFTAGGGFGNGALGYWVGEPCAGLLETPPFNVINREQFDNLQDPLNTRAQWFTEEERVPFGPGINEGSTRTTWNVVESRTVIDPCPGDAPPDANTQAIAEHMAKAHPCAGCG